MNICTFYKRVQIQRYLAVAPSPGVCSPPLGPTELSDQKALMQKATNDCPYPHPQGKVYLSALISHPSKCLKASDSREVDQRDSPRKG